MNANGKYTSKFVRLIAAAALLAFTPLPAGAQDNYPNHPVRIIVPTPPGGLADILARLVGEKLTAKWGQVFVVENRRGASGNIGAEAVARAAPDGYTLLVSPPTSLAINQSLFPTLSYDPGAFVPVTVIAMVPNVLVVRPAVPASNVEELIALAKTQPGKFNYASTGNGGTPHLTAEQLKSMTGVRIVHIPYTGVPAALTDLMGARVDMMFINLGDALPHIKSGKLKVLAVTSDERIATLPDVPIVAEALPGFVSVTWYGLAAPPKTHPEIATRLSAAIAEVLRLPDVAKKLQDFSATPVGSSPEDTARFFKREVTRWHKVILSAGIKPD